LIDKKNEDENVKVKIIDIKNISDQVVEKEKEVLWGEINITELINLEK
jgi:hypothetical protein